jgi:hypothetical protein
MQRIHLLAIIKPSYLSGSVTTPESGIKVVFLNRIESI